MSISLPSSPPKKPTVFGPYELMHRIGAGGMAETFFAVRKGLGGFEQWVCLKRILPAFDEDQEFVRLFMQEARVAARLRHSNIVQVIDFGRVDEAHYMALELVEGTDLKKLLKHVQVKQSANEQERGMGDRSAGYLGLCLAEALAYAHNADLHREIGAVFHRDVSPSNVLVSPNGEVKLTDFGIAKAANQGQVTQTGVVKGKVPYLAPEYMRQGKYDARADLFSLGVMMYEAVAGERPFDGHNELDTIARIADGRHTPLLEKRPSTRKDLAAIIEQLIQCDPDARFQNASALVTALEQAVEISRAKKELMQWVQSYGVKRPKTDPPSVAPSEENVSHSGLSVKPKLNEPDEVPTKASEGLGDSAVMSRATRTAFAHDAAHEPQQKSSQESYPSSDEAGRADSSFDSFKHPSKVRSLGPWVGLAVFVIAAAGLGYRAFSKPDADSEVEQVAQKPSFKVEAPAQPTPDPVAAAPETPPATQSQTPPESPPDQPPEAQLEPQTEPSPEPASMRTADTKVPERLPERSVRASRASERKGVKDLAEDGRAVSGASQPDKSAGSMAMIKFKGPFKTMPIFLDGRRVSPSASGTVTVAPGPHRITYGQHGSQFRNFPAGQKTLVVITDG